MRRAIVLLTLVGCTAQPRVLDDSWMREPIRRVDAPPVQSGRYAVDLAAVLRLAGVNSLEIAYVREKAREAYALAEQADMRLWPTIGPEFAFRRHEDRTQATDGTFLDVNKQQEFLGVRAKLRVDIGDAIFARLAAGQRLEGSLKSLESTQQAVALDTAIAYFELLRETMRERVAAQSVQIGGKLVAELDASVQIGKTFKGDLLRSRAQLASNQLNRLRAQESAKISAIRLASALRLAPEIELVPTEDVPVPLALVPVDLREEDAVSQALAVRPEIKEAEAELAASRHAKTGATWGPVIPEVVLEAAPGELGPRLGDLDKTGDYSILLGWKLGPGGLFDTGRQRLAEAKVSQAEILLARAKDRVAEQVRVAVAQLHSKREQMDLAKGALKDAEESLELNLKRQETGVGLPLEVLTAEEALTRARLDYMNSVIDNNEAQVRLLILKGGRLGQEGK